MPAEETEDEGAHATHWSEEECEGLLKAQARLYHEYEPSSHVFRDMKARKNAVHKFYSEWATSAKFAQRNVTTVDSMLSRIQSAFLAWTGKKERPSSVSKKLWSSLALLQPSWRAMQDAQHSRGAVTVSTATAAPPAAAAAAAPEDANVGHTADNDMGAGGEGDHTTSGAYADLSPDPSAETGNDSNDVPQAPPPLKTPPQRLKRPKQEDVPEILQKITKRDLEDKKRMRNTGQLVNSLHTASAEQARSSNDFLTAYMIAQQEERAARERRFEEEQRRRDEDRRLREEERREREARQRQDQALQMVMMLPQEQRANALRALAQAPPGTDPMPIVLATIANMSDPK